jgi:exodeoxyribonuclease VII small subunit
MNKDNQSTPQPDQQEKSFEAAFSRLEEILERMNSGTISLDESLKLYEEADALINMCSKRLKDAEGRVEMLLKNRSNDLILSNDQKPMTQDFTLPNAGAK